MTFIVSEDEALKAQLRGIYVADEKNPSREVGVWFAHPDVEQRAQAYPYITVELIDVTWANYRQASGEITDNDTQGTIEPEVGVSYTYHTPTAWDLTYQITSYARHPRHDRAIMAHLLSNDFVAKAGYLPVQNDLDTERSYRHLILEEFTKRDTIEDGRRLYRTVFTVTVSSESVSGSGISSPDVQEVLINTDPTYTPSDLQNI